MRGKNVIIPLMVCSMLLSACASPAQTAAATTAQTTSATTAAKETTTTSTTAAATSGEQNGADPSEDELDPPENEDEEDPQGYPETESNDDNAARTKAESSDVWYRTYRWMGSDDETAQPEDTILVEYNGKKNYVAMTMFFIGVNAFMSVDSVDLVPVDGEYWIQDFMNADGSEPDLTRVYMKYTDSAITLYYKTTGDDFDWSSPSVFAYEQDWD